MADDVPDEVVRARAGELESALGRWKLEGFDPVAGLDLVTAARLTAGLEPRLDTDGTRLIIAEMDGISEFSYSIHLSHQAVSLAGGVDFGPALGAAVAGIPDLAGIVQPLLSFINTHSSEIATQAEGGPIRLAGTVPSPFALPVAESLGFWEAERRRAEDAEAEARAEQKAEDEELEKELKDRRGNDGGWEGNPNNPLKRTHRGGLRS